MSDKTWKVDIVVKVYKLMQLMQIHEKSISSVLKYLRRSVSPTYVDARKCRFIPKTDPNSILAKGNFMEIWKTVEASHRCETSNEICPLCEMAEVRWCKGSKSASNYSAWAAYIFQAKVCAVHSVFTWTLPEQLAFPSTLFIFLVTLKFRLFVRSYECGRLGPIHRLCPCFDKWAQVSNSTFAIDAEVAIINPYSKFNIQNIFS